MLNATRRVTNFHLLIHYRRQTKSYYTGMMKTSMIGCQNTFLCSLDIFEYKSRLLESRMMGPYFEWGAVDE